MLILVENMIFLKSKKENGEAFIWRIKAMFFVLIYNIFLGIVSMLYISFYICYCICMCCIYEYM